MRGSGHGLLQALFRQLPEWSVSLRHKSHHGDIQAGQDPNWLPLRRHLRCSRRPCLQSTCSCLPEVAASAPGGATGSPDNSNAVLCSPSIQKALIIETDYFVWQLSVAASCRLAYLINAAHAADLDVAQGIDKP